MYTRPHPTTPPSSPPSTFNTPTSPPVPAEGCARFSPYEERLQKLDSIYEQSEHPIVDGWRMVGAGGVGNPWSEERRRPRPQDFPRLDIAATIGGAEMEEGQLAGSQGGNGGDASRADGGRMEEDIDEDTSARTRKAMKVLENHIRDRTPFVQVSSRRMQAVMGMRNDLAFGSCPSLFLLSTFSLFCISAENFCAIVQADLPEIKRPTASISLPSPTISTSSLDAGHSARTLSRNPSTSTFKFINPLSPLTSPSINPSTGKGLREWLLSQGKQFGMRKTECRSISFHDFTPDMRNNGWSNKLLGHFAADGSSSSRCDFYQVDLPITHTSPTTGVQTATTQTWLWFLISCPLLSVNPKNTSTRPRSHSKISHPSSVQSSPHQTYHTPATYPSSSPTPWPNSSPLLSAHQFASEGEGSRLPPNFQTPVPTSWMVFACPLDNVTSYPEAVDTQQAPPSSSSNPLSCRSKRALLINKNGLGASKKAYKRRDFDFSHNGVPVFEFNSSTSGLFPSHENLPPFLEIGELGPFYHGDEFSLLSDAEFEHKVKSVEENRTENWLGEVVEGGNDLQSPYSGQWWKVFYESVGRDAARWEGIRGAMGRGRCRVVLRYAEFEVDPDSQNNFGEMDVDAIGLGIGGLENVGGGGEGKKIRERLVGRQRLTRSETRRRSGLGMSEVSSSGVVVGIGNKDLVAGKGVKGGRGKK